ncbi:MAG: hypothetical protein HY744_11540 [Deltaproteobacteria bacterium]|nr:hypothetical protein [Deltaproteobacteria bacterium]
MLVGSPARAGIEACGNIDVDASAKCEVKLTGGCTVMCEPISFTAACDAKCSGQCNVSLDVECKGSCEAECSGQCEADPGKFDCEAKCEGQCGGECSGKCSSSDDKSACEGSCKATCSGECGASCEVVPPQAKCEAKCEAQCEGYCKAEAKVDCDIDCHAGCVVDLKGGCEAACEEPEGALFCDGQYVDDGGNLQECIDSLKAQLNIVVTGQASADCSGSECTAEAEGSVSCATAPQTRGGVAWFAALVAAIGLTALGRRRRGRS